MNKRNLITIAVSSLLLAAVGGAYYWWGLRQAQAEYRFAKIERGTVTAAVSATGTVNPVVSVQVGSQVSGQIKEIYVDFNAPVTKGQIIARIDPEPFQLRVNQAQADLEATRATVLTQLANVGALRSEVSRAKVNLDDAERDLNRNKTLFEKNFVSAAALDKARAAFEGAQEQLKITQAQLTVGETQVRNGEAVVKQRESQLAQSRVDLEHTTIRAPVDGIVISRNVDAGQTVAASLQAPILFVIAKNLIDMQVETSIDESEVGRTSVGQPASFTVDSFPGRTFRGTVSQVRKAALVVQNVVTYIAVIKASNPDLSLFPGMTANVRIIVDSRENVLKVPNAALRFRPAGASDAAGATASTQEPVAAAEGQGKGRDAQAAGKGERERLTKELELSPEQQAKLDAIFSDIRDKIRALASDDKAERRKLNEQLRAESRTRIAEILTAEQRTKYEAMGTTRTGTTAGRVWTTDESGRPKPINVRLGLSDGSYSEVLSGEVSESMPIIVGTIDASKVSQQQKSAPGFNFKK